ncbi:glycosyltransferase [Laspinema sp. D1]|uniref:Glycosyltransferase n=1 Tax=Laspinema palackyanum D2a TaxID=2953684 RepID=A0ABT2MUZ1_9CYAN|nr:glycosyltransferase [Laspinema sp. D2a]
MPKVSVVIPTYNCKRFIKETINSVLSQTYLDFEVIVIDDGSTDGTAEILNDYGSTLRYIYQKNKGQGAARNVGIRACNGEYIAFLDSDDMWLPNKLERQMALIDSGSSINFVYCDVEVFEHLSGQRLFLAHQLFKPYEGNNIASKLLINNFIFSCTPLINKKVFEEVGYFDESRLLQGLEDWDMWLRIAASYPLAWIPEPLGRYRIHDANMIGNSNYDPLKFHQQWIAVIKRITEIYPQVYAPVYSQAMSNAYWNTSAKLLSKSQNSQARQLLYSAIRHYPLCSKSYLLGVLSLMPLPIVQFILKLRQFYRKFYGVNI